MEFSELNLEPPADFRGLDPGLPVRFYQRHLPHWRQNGATYFLTFRLADSITRTQLAALKRWRLTWEREHPGDSENDWQQLAREITARTDRYLDQGFGECVFGEQRIANVMSQSLLKFQDQRYLISSFIIMPNHVHLTMKPLPGFELEDILCGIKGFVARQVNVILNRTKKLWEQESYDRIIRDEMHLYQVIQYIGNNARKAGLPDRDWRRWIHPDWERLGWQFDRGVR